MFLLNGRYFLYDFFDKFYFLFYLYKRISNCMLTLFLSKSLPFNFQAPFIQQFQFSQSICKPHHHSILRILQNLTLPKQSENIQIIIFPQSIMNKKTVAVLVTILFPINLIINYLYSEPLYHLGVDLILQMQQYSNPALDYFFIFFTILVDPMLIISACCIYSMVAKKKLTAIVIVFFVLLNTFFLTISKSFYAAPRPYWTHENVKNIGYYCPKDYGQPSGHAQFISIIVCVILFELVDTKKQIKYGFLGVFLMLGVSVSRMYLGGHSLDQVIQGLFLGISLSLLFVHGGLKEIIADLLVKQKQKKYRDLFIAITAFMHILYIWAYLENFKKTKQNKKSAKIWLKNYNLKCGKDIDEEYLNNVMLTLNAFLTNYITGMIMGSKKMLQNPQSTLFLTGKWNINTKSNKFVQYLKFYTIPICLLTTGFIVFSPILLILGKSFYSSFIFTSLSALVSSYFFSGWSFNILKKLQLINFQKQKESQ